MRRLSLKKDTLTELATAELASVVAGVTTSGYYPTIPLAGCDTWTVLC